MMRRRELMQSGARAGDNVQMTLADRFCLPGGVVGTKVSRRQMDASGLNSVQRRTPPNIALSINALHLGKVVCNYRRILPWPSHNAPSHPFDMASTQAERVNNALQQLLERLVPSYLDEDEATADQRWDDANDLARSYIDAEPEANIAEDVNHAADLIKRKFIREEGSPEKATAFGNLYSRLLSQPVLGQKWAILYFLLKISDGGDASGQPPRRSSSGQAESQRGTNARPENIRRSSRPEQQPRNGSREYAVDSPAFNEAFSKNGLPRLPRAQEDAAANTAPLKDRTTTGRPKLQALRDDTPEAEREIQRAKVTNRIGEPSESALLRDIPFTLQGLSSTNMAFDGPTTLKLPDTLPVPLIALLHTLAEPSLLYRSLAEFAESTEGGLVCQSLRSAIGIELRSYLSLVARLESEIRRALFQLDESLPHSGLGKAGVTLKRCVIWTREATLGLRLMSLIVDSSKGKKGGELISVIHNFSASHGDPFVHTFAERLLGRITKPFYSMQRAWIYDGELEDPYREFFVYENVEAEDNAATSVWEQKYRMHTPMIPTIMTADFAQRVFLIGKSLNFIRHGCGDSAWVENFSRTHSQALTHNDDDTTSLSTTIDAAYTIVMARLTHLMSTKFALFTHLRALKSYLLLGSGDFTALLLESLAPALDRPANSQYRHTLTAQLEHAIRNSNAQHDPPEVLRRLDARMLELSHGEIGWDVFTLEYRVDAPLDVIITPWASKQYLKVFNFLWRVKRVEFALASTWRRCMTGARGVLAAVGDKLGADWKAARGGVSEMVHFVNQLQYYILFEVIEAGWEGLMREMRKPGATLDTLIEAHTAYLRSITRKGLLGGGGQVGFTSQLHELLKLMLAYRDAVDSLYSYSVAEFTRRQEAAAKIETRTKAGKWGIMEQDEEGAASGLEASLFREKGRRRGEREREAESPLPQLLPWGGQHGGDGGGERDLLEGLRQRLRALEADFKSRVNVLLGDLAYQPDVDMRFLGVVMNFNEVYQPVKRRRQHRGEREGKKGPATAIDGKDRDKGDGAKA